MKFFKYLFFCLTSCIVFAQEPVSVHLTENDGLPDIEFYSMIEDSDGFLWFTCNKGLYRYDGEVFKQFSHPEKRGRSFFNLRLDAYGRVWCNNISGQFFYVKGNELILFGDYKEELKGQLVDFSFYGNSILIKKPSSNSILEIDLESKKLQNEIKNTASQGVGNPVANETQFLNSDFNIVGYNPTVKKYITHTHKTSSLYNLMDKRIFIHYFNVNNYVFILTQDSNYKNAKLFSLNKKSNKIEEIILPKQLVKIRINHLISIDGDLYISTKKGVFVSNFKNEKLVVKEIFFKDFFITQLLKDKNDNIWVSSLKNGIWVLPNRKLKKYNSLPNIEVLEKKNDTVCFLGRRSGELLEMNINTNNNNIYDLGDGSEIRALDYNEPEKQLFFSSDSQTYIYNEETKKHKELQSIPGLKSVSRVKNNQFLVSAHNEAFIRFQV